MTSPFVPDVAGTTRDGYYNDDSSYEMGDMLPQDGDSSSMEQERFEMENARHRAPHYKRRNKTHIRTNNGYINAKFRQEEMNRRREAEEEIRRRNLEQSRIEMAEEEERRMYSEREISGVSISESTALNPPVGDWSSFASVKDRSHEIRRMVANSDNVFQFEFHKSFTVKDIPDADWYISNSTEMGEKAFYAYRGSPFNDNRKIMKIVLMNSSQDSPVSLGLTASLIHPVSGEEVFKPIIPVFSNGMIEGPSHVSLRPNTTNDNKIVLWYSRQSWIPETVRNNPTVTREDLISSLGQHPRKNSGLRTVNLDNLLTQYTLERLDRGIINNNTNPIAWKKDSGYGEIEEVRANALINSFIKDQTEGLYLYNLVDMKLCPTRSHRTDEFIPVSEDLAEIGSSVPAHNYTNPESQKIHAELLRDKKVFNVHCTVYVELEPL